jgi:hypothetical protein
MVRLDSKRIAAVFAIVFAADAYDMHLASGLSFYAVNGQS